MSVKLYLTTDLQTEHFCFANWAANHLLTPVRDFFGGKTFIILEGDACDVTPQINSEPFWKKTAVMISLFVPALICGFATYHLIRQFQTATIATILTPVATLTAVIILGIVARILSLQSEEVKRGFALINKKPSDPVPQQQEMPVATRKILERLQTLLQPGQKIGTAIDNGDCFYDAVAQTLRAKGVDVSMKNLRVMVSKAVQEEAWKDKIDALVLTDYLGIGETYDGQYWDYVAYTGDELNKLTDVKKPSNPFWGAPDREGLIFCRKYGFALRVLSVGINDDFIENDPEYKRRKGMKDTAEEFWEKNGGLEQEGARKIMEMHKTNLQERRDALLANDAAYWTSDETYPKEHNYQTVCTIAVYKNHFVPILG